jgi:hypothetical protein
VGGIWRSRSVILGTRYPDPVRNNLDHGVEVRSMSDLFEDPPEIGIDADEADVLEQALEVPAGDEEGRDR